MERVIYDCDTYDYWSSDEDYMAKERKYGSFVRGGEAYRITERNTPRPWLNYLCNDRFAGAVSNTGLGFQWYKTSILRITKYEHPIDYLPRQFEDGREIVIKDEDEQREFSVFKDAQDLLCTHNPGYTQFEADFSGIKVKITIFVPLNDPLECMQISVKNETKSKKNLIISTGQTWSIARFGFHTADEGIPYLSTPGKNLNITESERGIFAYTDNDELPFPIYAGYFSSGVNKREVTYDVQRRKGDKIFKFAKPCLRFDIALDGKEERKLNVVSYATEYKKESEGLIEKYSGGHICDEEFELVKANRAEIVQSLKCKIEDKNLQNFLNVWLKNQLHLTFRYGRSCYIGYRDTIQDTWGYELIDTELSKKQILKVLSHMKKDGSCPRSFSPFGMWDKQDLRNNMDSATWLAMCISDYVKESGDTGILYEKIRYLDDENEETVLCHIRRAFDLLFEKRGFRGMCLTCDGDWNDALEGISKHGPAVSVWLTIALFHGQNILRELYAHIGECELAALMEERSEILKNTVNENAWDGEWFIYAFSGKGTPIGSKSNKEGFIHLNVNTWAIFTGIADNERIVKIEESINKYLSTEIGPALLHPPYVNEGELVGRIARLEPGTFENGSVYQHAAAFKIFSDLSQGDYDGAYQTFVKLLPTNPNNFDARRTSEPYCMGNYYCGPSHKRFGQNFFTWFTGNPAWLLRAGFDNILGIKAEFNGLKIEPKVPKTWNEYKVEKRLRGVLYRLHFKRGEIKGAFIDGEKQRDNIICYKGGDVCNVKVIY